MHTLRIVSRLALLPLLALAGCTAGAADTEETDQGSEEAFGVRQGVDYSWARPSPQGLHSAGYTFAARYVSAGASGKNISHGEAQALIAAGVDVVLVWEEGATDALGGYGRGVADAKQAEANATAAGMPSDRPIYFAVDFDAQPNEQGTIDAYFDGVASVLGRKRTGAYGGYYLIKRLFDAGKITWGWQAYAWSYGHWDARAQLRQWHNDKVVAGGDCDLDSAMVADFGQWGKPVPKGPPTPAPNEPSGCGTIHAGHGLVQGKSFASCDGRFELAMQHDGNLVLYAGETALWASGTYGSDGYAADFQTDGNLVVYGHHSNALWASHTSGHAGSKLVVQDDGNLVVYSSSGHALWASNTDVGVAPKNPTVCGVMRAGEGLSHGDSLASCDGKHVLAMQGDGNLVVYHHGKGAIWATNTDHTSGLNAVLQSDGNFVLYDVDKKPLWDSHTYGHPGAWLAMQDDGNLVVYSSQHHALWASGTNGK